MSAKLADVELRIGSLLSELGTGPDMGSIAYDTAWLARLHSDYPQRGFEAALEWVRRNQHPDGSWGSAMIHYHDRAISTLSCLVALRMLGRQEDAERARRAQAALWRLCGRLRQDAQDTIGFPLISVSLLEEASRCSCDVPSELAPPSDTIRKKLVALTQSPELLRSSTAIYSFEALSSRLPPVEMTDWYNDDGLIAASPSATVAGLGRARNERALDALRDLMARQRDGGAPNICPIDTFEIAWSLNHLRIASAISPEDPAVKVKLEYLREHWSPSKGMYTSSGFTIQDADDTAVSFQMLRWGGFPVSADAFGYYEREDCFYTFPHEADPSISTNVHVLAALRTVDDDAQRDAWIKKCLAMLKRHKSSNLWFDKWHVSPYYATCDAIHAIHGLDDELIQPSVRWISRTQREDGGWGFCGTSTAEETAYAMQALLTWRREDGDVDPEQLAAGARYLWAHIDDRDFPALWIGKGLYTPLRVVRAAVQAALYRYLTR
jgi:hypothetical protein